LADNIERLKELDSEIQRLSHIAALLSWDQETYMPEGAIEERAEQKALLEGMIHERVTSPEMAEIFSNPDFSDSKTALPGLTGTDQAFLREAYRRYRLQSKLSTVLVRRIAKETSLALAKWAEAREKADFTIFSGNLETILMLVREKADALGYEEHIYDPLLDEFEPWMKTKELRELFQNMQKGLTALLSRITASGTKVESGFLKREYPVDKQRQLSLSVLKSMGYDFKYGRLDLSAHPFTITLGSTDVRLTTRYDRNFFPKGLFGTIHEGGHGLYELGISPELHGSLLADGTSMGIHESQSRLWENFIGRSRPFWRWFYPQVKELFPAALADIDLDTFYRGINVVEPSFIRVEADEVTYNLHIILRFNLERALVSGDLRVKDLPEAWNQESRELLGITPPDVSLGVLQDIHWSMGGIGYFPTYALGNLYAAQFFKTLKKELPRVAAEVEQGNFIAILTWLREKIHSPGKVYTAGELCTRVTGEALNPDYYLQYLEEKYSAIYRF
jgi:carboxypeptidase Taq